MNYYFFCGYNLDGSGYTTIIKHLGLELHAMGHPITIFSSEYRGQEFNEPFNITGIPPQGIPEAIRYMVDYDKPETSRIIIAYDIPRILDFITFWERKERPDIVGQIEVIIPVESYPINVKWLNYLQQIKKIYVISEFGQDILKQSGVASEFLPIGCNFASYNRPDKQTARTLLKMPEDKTIYLMVADNQERKNIPVAMEAMIDMPDDCLLYLVTVPNRVNGWDLQDMANEYQIEDKVHFVPFPVDQGILSLLYWASDALLVTSQAEGACLPIYEAIGHGLPVIAGSWTGMRDVKDLPFVLPIDFEYSYRFAWGNVLRFFASANELIEKMIYVHNNKDVMEELSNKALTYSRERTWKKTAEVLHDTK